MADTCRGCIYFRSLSENKPNLKHYCNYLLDTGNTRDCPAESCDKKLTKEEAMKKLTIEEKKPDTAATVTDSEQEDLVDIPADIVTQETENVKPVDDFLPCAVVDAVANEIDRLYDRLTECDREMQKIRDARANAENDLKELKAFLKKNGFGDVVKALDSDAKWRALNESTSSL